MEHFLDHYGYAAILLVALVEAVYIPFPSEVTFGLHGRPGATREYGFSLPGVIGAGVAGEIIGCVVAYWIGRSAGRALIGRYGKFVLISRADLDRADRFMATRGAPAVFLGRFIPFVRAVISLVAGIGEMPFVRFVVSTPGATVLYGVGVAWLGYALGDHWHKIVKSFTDAGIVAAVLVVLVIVFGLLHRLLALRAERDVAR